jgi:hypothetical protein
MQKMEDEEPMEEEDIQIITVNQCNAEMMNNIENIKHIPNELCDDDYNMGF